MPILSKSQSSSEDKVKWKDQDISYFKNQNLQLAKSLNHTHSALTKVTKERDHLQQKLFHSDVRRLHLENCLKTVCEKVNVVTNSSKDIAQIVYQAVHTENAPPASLHGEIAGDGHHQFYSTSLSKSSLKSFNLIVNHVSGGSSYNKEIQDGNKYTEFLNPENFHSTPIVVNETCSKITNDGLFQDFSISDNKPSTILCKPEVLVNPLGNSVTDGLNYSDYSDCKSSFDELEKTHGHRLMYPQVSTTENKNSRRWSTCSIIDKREKRKQNVDLSIFPKTPKRKFPNGSDLTSEECLSAFDQLKQSSCISKTENLINSDDCRLTSETKECVPGKKRGRKPKKELAESPGTTPIILPKRGRGKPRKLQLTDDKTHIPV